MLINSAASTACNKTSSGFNGPAVRGLKSALIRRFFILLCLCWTYTGQAEPTPDIPDSVICHPDKYDEKITVKEVIDGDTIILADGRHVRLIGINTPEIGRDNQKSEMGAEQALDYLSRLLKTNKILQLSYDKERKDRYGRTLAHLFLHDGTNLQSLMLKRGLATALTIPPNLDYLDCYQASIDFARTHSIGLWALTQYQTIPAQSVGRNDLGYRIITGTVSRTGESKSSIWINLTKNVALRITRDDLGYFDRNFIQSINGKQITARGWIYFINGEFRMRIRHPADISIASIPARN